MFRTITFSSALAAAGLFASAGFAAENLTAETGPPGGAPHLSMIHLAEVVGEAGIANLQVQESQTLTNSILNLAQGKTDIAGTPLVLPFLLSKGRGPYSKTGGKAGKKLAANLRALYPYSFGAYHLFAFQSSGITSWKQLKGKKIYNGPPRGGALVGARGILQLVAGLKEGKNYTGIQVNWGQAIKTILDGSADANLLPNTFPGDRIVAAQAAGKVNIISVPKATWESAAFQRYAVSPGNAPLAIAGNKMGYGSGVKLISEDGMFRGVGITGAEVVNKNMSFAIAKAITAQYIKTMDRLKGKAPYAANIGVGVLDPKQSGFCGLNPLKYHAGAVAAWKEAGKNVPDCALPPAT